MKLPAKSAKNNVDIEDYYAIKIGALWRGLKQESPALWWLCIYLFFEYVRPQTIYPVIDFLPWGQISLLLACVTAVLDKSIKAVSHTANALFVLFFIVVLLSSVFAFQPSISFDKIEIPINWLVLYYLMITILNTEKKFFIFMLLFLIVNFKMSQHGFISYASRGFGYASWGLAGSPGWFQNAGDFGIQMAIFTPLVISFILALQDYWGRFKKLFFFLFPLTALVTIVGTASRGAQLGLVATGIWFLLKSGKGVKAMLGIGLLGWALFSILPEKMLEEYSSAGDDNTSEDRLVLWEYGLEVVGDHPVLGVGFENWVRYCFYEKPYIVAGRTTCHEVHNTYVEALTEIGITGFSIFIILLLFMLVLNARTRVNADQSGNKFIWYIAHGLDGGLVGCMVASVFFSILFYPMFWVQFMMIVTLNILSKKTNNDIRSSGFVGDNK